MHVAAMKPVALTSADVPADLIEKERAVATAKAEEDRKVAEAAGKPVQPPKSLPSASKAACRSS